MYKTYHLFLVTLKVHYTKNGVKRIDTFKRNIQAKTEAEAYGKAKAHANYQLWKQLRSTIISYYKIVNVTVELLQERVQYVPYY